MCVSHRLETQHGHAARESNETISALGEGKVTCRQSPTVIASQTITRVLSDREITTINALSLGYERAHVVRCEIKSTPLHTRVICIENNIR